MIYLTWNLYMRVVLNSFTWKTSSSPKKFFRQTLVADPSFIFNGTCWPRLVRKHWRVISSNLFQASAPLSHFILWQLHLNIYVLLWDVGPCSPSSANSDTSTPELSGLPFHLASWNLDTTSPQFRPPSFQGKAFFRHALAKLSWKIVLYFYR